MSKIRLAVIALVIAAMLPIPGAVLAQSPGDRNSDGEVYRCTTRTLDFGFFHITETWCGWGPRPERGDQERNKGVIQSWMELIAEIIW